MKRFLTPGFLLLSALPAMAHPAPFHGAGMLDASRAGFLHPFGGFDHLLVMVAVGLWAVQLGGRALLLLPCAFVGSMVAGAALGLSGLHPLMAEPGILASLVLLGTALGMAWRPPVAVAALFAGLSGLCHGFAHGIEMPGGITPALYLAGMVCATGVLHGFGLGGGVLLGRKPFLITSRAGGAVMLSVALLDSLRGSFASL